MILTAAMAFMGASVAQADDAALALGKQVFLEIAQPQCALCHTLACWGVWRSGSSVG